MMRGGEGEGVAKGKPMPMPRLVLNSTEENEEDETMLLPMMGSTLLSERSLSADGSVAMKRQHALSSANPNDEEKEESDEEGERCEKHNHSDRHQGLTRGQRSLARKLELKEARKNRRVSRRALTPLHYAAGALDVDETLRLLSIAAAEDDDTKRKEKRTDGESNTSNSSSGSIIKDMLLAVDVSDSTPLHHATILQRVRVDPWRVNKADLLSRSARIVRAILDVAKRASRKSTSSLQHKENNDHYHYYIIDDGKANLNSLSGATASTSTDTYSRVIADSLFVASSVVLARDRMGRTSLHLSAGYCDGDHIRLLISALFADIADTCPYVCTSFRPLLTDQDGNRCHLYDHDYLSPLCQSFTSIDPKDDTGKTPLMEAAKTGNVEALAALIREGADVSAIDNKGKTALDYCEAFLFTNTMMLEKKRHHARQQALYQQYQQQQQQPQGGSSTPSLPGHVGASAVVAGPDLGLAADAASSSSPPLPPQSLTSFIHRPHDDEDKLVDSIARGTVCVDMLKDAGGEGRASPH